MLGMSRMLWAGSKAKVSLRPVLAVAGFLNASDFVVNVMEDAASLVGALNEVAGFVVGVAAVDGAAGQRVLFAAGGLCAAPDGTLAFQTTHGVVVVQAADAALRPLDFAVQFVAFDVADDFRRRG